jgi:hypothetical protein
MEPARQSPRNGKSLDNDGSARRAKLDHAKGSAEQAWSHAREAFTDVREAVDLQGRVDRHPFGTLVAAAGIGYLLGGGLFTRLTARMLGFTLRTGLRLAVIPMIQDELLGLADVLGRQREVADDDNR